MTPPAPGSGDGGEGQGRRRPLGDWAYSRPPGEDHDGETGLLDTPVAAPPQPHEGPIFPDQADSTVSAEAPTSTHPSSPPEAGRTEPIRISTSTTSPPGVSEETRPLDTAFGTPPGEPPTGGGSRNPRMGPRGRRRKGPFGFLKELPALIIMAFLLALLIKTFLVQAFYIPSESMVPTLQVGDRVLVNKLAYKFGGPSRGDVIVFESSEPVEGPDRNPVAGFFHWVVEGLGITAPDHEDFIKRVVGLPGETVEIKKGIVYVDGARVREPYIDPLEDRRSFPPEEVAEGHVFVMGDNRYNSNDSRFQLGQIPIDKIVGRAFIVIWPPSNMGGLADGASVG